MRRIVLATTLIAIAAAAAAAATVAVAVSPETHSIILAAESRAATPLGIEAAAGLYRHAVATAPECAYAHAEAALFQFARRGDVAEADRLARRAQRLDAPAYRSHFHAIFVAARTRRRKQLGRINLLRSRLDAAPANASAMFVDRRMAERVFHSCAIEGGDLSLEAVRSLLRSEAPGGGGGGGGGEHALSHAAMEVLGAADAERAILRAASTGDRVGPLELHRHIFGRVGAAGQAGAFRNETVYIAGHCPPAPGDVPGIFGANEAWLDSAAARRMHVAERAAAYHWRVASLHPFVDGNGRASRAAMNAVLAAFGFPPVVIHHADRFRYYEACRVAQLDANLAPLTDLVLLALETELTRALADATSRSARERERRYAEFADATPRAHAIVPNTR